MGKIKKFFVKTGQWFKNHAPTKRRLIQVYAALLFNANIKGYFSGGQNIIYRGNTKYLCSPGLNCYSCPGAVTACPLGALQNALSSSDQRAPYYVLGILALLGLMLGRTICGFLCPVGLGQELLHKIKTPKLKKSRYTRILSYFKYVLLVVFVIAIPLIYNTVPGFCKYICPAGTAASVLQLSNGNNSDLYAMLGYLFSWKFSLLIIFIVGSIFIYRFFCRFFCPLGAIYGFFNKIALIGVKLDKQKCIDCGLCIQTCKMDIRHVGDHECIECGECIAKCPTKAISWKGSKIFLHGLDSELPAEEKAPLAAMLSGGTANTSETLRPVQSVNAAVTVITPEPVAGANAEDKAEEEREERYKAVENKIKKRSFWLQFSAWTLALLVLIGALVYYNLFSKGSVATTFGEGDKLPDFTLSKVFDNAGAYGADGEKIEKFSTLECRGTVTVINFWYTTCEPCVAELPGFDRVKQEFGDDVIIVAVHAAGMVSNDKIQEFIDSNWSDFSIMFSVDTSSVDCYTMLGGKSTYPMTVIIDADGVITYVRQGSMEEDVLREEIASAMNK